MAEFQLIMPKMGESIMEATILKWLKKPGDPIGEDEAVLEIATDKVDSEVPSPVKGTLSNQLFKEGDVVAVGKAVAMIQTEGPEAAKSNGVEEVVEQVSTKHQEAGRESPRIETAVRQPAIESNRFYSPLVMNIAKREQIGMSELESVPGTGKEGRVTKKDMLAYLDRRTEKDETLTISFVEPGPKQEAKEPKTPVTAYGDNVEIIEMDRMRKLIADHMVMSKRTSPHVTSFVEADVTNLVLWRERMKKVFETREREKLTYTPLFIEAIIKAIKDFPLINSSVDGHRIIRKKDINIGMATALPGGNLIVPVIHNADYLNLTGIARKVNDLASRAREGKLKPQDIEGGTFTITNVGTFGNLMGTPIINQPQVSILATGAIKKKPVVVETKEGDVIAIRHMMFLSHSYDHRVVDGAMGGAFVRKVADYLEAFDTAREA